MTDPNDILHERDGGTYSAADVWLHWITAGLIVLRVGAALKHQFIDRDGVFQRMWPTSHP